jgi:hypothetical protein
MVPIQASDLYQKSPGLSGPWVYQRSQALPMPVLTGDAVSTGEKDRRRGEEEQKDHNSPVGPNAQVASLNNLNAYIKKLSRCDAPD